METKYWQYRCQKSNETLLKPVLVING